MVVQTRAGQWRMAARNWQIKVSVREPTYTKPLARFTCAGQPERRRARPVLRSPGPAEADLLNGFRAIGRHLWAGDGFSSELRPSEAPKKPGAR